MIWLFRNALIGLLILWLVVSVFGFLLALGWSDSLGSLLRSPRAWFFLGGQWFIVAALAIYLKVRPE